MIKLKEAVIVEGKYDKIRLSSFLDAVIIETGGFRIFKDKEKMKLIKSLADKNGIVILTDSDNAGFMIRSKLMSCIEKEKIKNAYIPDIIGKERRKAAYSKERKLGVEGMETEVLKKALERAGVIEGVSKTDADPITTADLYELGLSGRADSRQKRAALMKKMNLPENMSTKMLMDVLNALYTKEEFIEYLEA